MTPSEAMERCWAEIDLDVLLSNYQYALSHLGKDCRLMAVLKADAYGHGAGMAAKFLREQGQTLFAAACLSEAMEIRRDVPDADVLILGLTGEAETEAAVREGLLLTVFSREQAERCLRAARHAGKPARVHLKVETGLHRLGLTPDEAPETARRLADGGNVSIEGLYTHLALRNRESDMRQIALLLSCKKAMEAQGVTVPCVHALDSIGMVRYPEYHLDAVRTGAWLWGVCPRGYDRPEECRMVMTVKCRVAQLHSVAKGECLGYDETHPLARDSVIATLSAGYMDGFPRLNSQGYVLIHGQKAPVAGLVCMDQMMVDVTDIPAAREGDEAILLGSGIGVEEYAAVGRLNHNEALARTGRRVPRVYLREGKIIEIRRETP